MWQVSMSDVRNTDLFFSRRYGDKPIGIVGCRSVGKKGKSEKREEGRRPLNVGYCRR